MTRTISLVLTVVVVLALANGIFVISEREQAIITQFGEPVGEPILDPGLKFKIPFIQKYHVFDKRFLEWEGSVSELPTKDKVFILIDAYARWRITDPLLFYQRNPGGERGAQSRLDDILNSATRSSIAKHELLEVIRTSNRQPVQGEVYSDLEVELAPVESGREVIRQEILASAKRLAAQVDLGIEILDIQFKRINYGDQVLVDVYNRMISERVRISDRFRSEGQGERAEILGDMERELQRVQSEAYREAEEIIGRADAAATEIYARAFNQSADSREFYEFLKTMETFERTVDAETTLVLSTDGDFYRFLKKSGR